jgi:hypothetical protein
MSVSLSLRDTTKACRWNFHWKNAIFFGEGKKDTLSKGGKTTPEFVTNLLGHSRRHMFVRRQLIYKKLSGESPKKRPERNPSPGPGDGFTSAGDTDSRSESPALSVPEAPQSDLDFDPDDFDFDPEDLDWLLSETVLTR